MTGTLIPANGVTVGFPPASRCATRVTFPPACSCGLAESSGEPDPSAASAGKIATSRAPAGRSTGPKRSCLARSPSRARAPRRRSTSTGVFGMPCTTYTEPVLRGGRGSDRQGGGRGGEASRRGPGTYGAWWRPSGQIWDLSTRTTGGAPRLDAERLNKFATAAGGATYGLTPDVLGPRCAAKQRQPADGARRRSGRGSVVTH